VRAVDGPPAALPCASGNFYRRRADCEDEKTCEVRKRMRVARDTTGAILDNTSLAEAAALNTVKQKPRRTEKVR
jgi:DNA-binding IscR family transcriptional regulator